MTNVQQPGGPTEDWTTVGGAASGTGMPGQTTAGGTTSATTGTTSGAHAAGSGSSGSGSSSSSGGGKADTAKEEASKLGGSAKDAGRRVAGTAKEEAHNVASEAKTQGKRLLDQAMHEASSQTKAQQQRAAEGISTFAGDLRGMVDGSGGGDGFAAQLVTEIGDRVEAAGRWLEDREPSDLLDEVKSFARRRPGTFIAIAGVTGLVVGRLTAGMISQAKAEHERERGSAGSYGSTPSGAYGATGTSGYGYGTSGYDDGAAGTTAYGTGAGTGTAGYGTTGTGSSGYSTAGYTSGTAGSGVHGSAATGGYGTNPSPESTYGVGQGATDAQTSGTDPAIGGYDAETAYPGSDESGSPADRQPGTRGESGL